MANLETGARASVAAQAVATTSDVPLSYAIITPARNEAENLGRLAKSIAGQTAPPAFWVIVDDASDDGMDLIARDLADHRAWILYRNTTDSRDGLKAGRWEGRDLEAFRLGLRALPHPVDVFVKVDADTSFEPEYFATLLAKFDDDPSLGIGGGSCYETRDGQWQRVKVSDSHPRGASRAYRWELLEDVMSLERRMGWDGVDEIMAELRGYRTAGFTDIGFRHHRPVGAREGRVNAGRALGHQAFYMGYRPTYVMLRALYRAREDIASLAMVWGFVESGLRRDSRCADPRIIARIRSRQRLRVVLRRGGWS